MEHKEDQIFIYSLCKEVTRINFWSWLDSYNGHASVTQITPINTESYKKNKRHFKMCAASTAKSRVVLRSTAAQR